MTLLDEVIDFAQRNAEAAKIHWDRETWQVHHDKCVKVRAEITKLCSELAEVKAARATEWAGFKTAWDIQASALEAALAEVADRNRRIAELERELLVGWAVSLADRDRRIAQPKAFTEEENS
jgi:hypothetical protein